MASICWLPMSRESTPCQKISWSVLLPFWTSHLLVLVRRARRYYSACPRIFSMHLWKRKCRRKSITRNPIIKWKKLSVRNNKFSCVKINKLIKTVSQQITSRCTGWKCNSNEIWFGSLEVGKSKMGGSVSHSKPSMSIFKYWIFSIFKLSKTSLMVSRSTPLDFEPTQILWKWT